MTVGLCDSVHHHALFSPGQNNNTIVIYVPSDKYGYPRLVATHYIPANEVHDTLADWAFYKRRRTNRLVGIKNLVRLQY